MPYVPKDSDHGYHGDGAVVQPPKIPSFESWRRTIGVPLYDETDTSKLGTPKDLWVYLYIYI